MLSNYNTDNKDASIIGKYDNVLTEISTTESTITKLKKYSNAAKIIDKINLKYFSQSPLAIYSHSIYATKKMLDLVIGKMNENFLFKEQIENSLSFESKNINDENNIMTHESTQRIKFRRYKLTSKSAVNSSKSLPCN